RRCKEMGILETHKDYETVFRQFQAIKNEYEVVKHNIIEDERPPMNTIPEYREKFGLDKKKKK
ncbi:MAG: glucosyl-3-phosphoglycerate synthase, partial [Balneolia bacterium]|nr:glucosyl-3-phosphoglycerate synthase [Balneolia bacterium]